MLLVWWWYAFTTYRFTLFRRHSSSVSWEVGYRRMCAAEEIVKTREEFSSRYFG